MHLIPVSYPALSRTFRAALAVFTIDKGTSQTMIAAVSGPWDRPLGEPTLVR